MIWFGKVRQGSMCLNHPELVHKHPAHQTETVRYSRTTPNSCDKTHRCRGNKVCRVLMHLFGVVQAHRTSSNLPEPHHYRDSKVCYPQRERERERERCSQRKFGPVEPPRTRVKEPCYLCEDVVRECSMCLNHPELVHPALLLSPVKM